MLCASCGFANPEGMKFCEECGTKLVRACPSCGHMVNPTAKFCGECGTPLARPVASSKVASLKSDPQPLIPNPQPLHTRHLAERIRAEQAAEAPGETVSAKRSPPCLPISKARQRLIEGLDPEEARAIIDPALQLMMDAVHQL